jgi:hypothetical protein
MSCGTRNIRRSDTPGRGFAALHKFEQAEFLAGRNLCAGANGRRKKHIPPQAGGRDTVAGRRCVAPVTIEASYFAGTITMVSPPVLPVAP